MDTRESPPDGSRTASGASHPESIVCAAARDVFGSDLRFIATYEGDTLSVVEARDPGPDPAVLDEIADEVDMAVVGGNPYQTSLYDAGPLEFVVHGFRDAVVVRLRHSPTTGSLVVLDPVGRGDLSEFLSVIDDA